MFVEGSYVRQGQQLYQIDEAPYRAAYDRANATLQSARKRADRDSRLVAANAVSRQQHDDSVASYGEARADLETARINLAYTKVYAPIAGRIGRSAITEGALVTNGQAQSLAVVQQLDPIYVDVTKPSVDVLRLQDQLKNGKSQPFQGGTANVSLIMEDGSVYERRGVLKFSEVSVDPGTASVTIRAEFPNPEHRLLPGMFVHARLEEGIREGAIVIPQQAVTWTPSGQAMVWVIDLGGAAIQRKITVDRTLGNTWLVTEGLQAGEHVVTEGVQRLQQGVKVSAVPATNVSLDLGDIELTTPPTRL